MRGRINNEPFLVQDRKNSLPAERQYLLSPLYVSPSMVPRITAEFTPGVLKFAKLTSPYVLPSLIREQYQKYRNPQEKVLFRQAVADVLGPEVAPLFLRIKEALTQDGVIMFRNFIDHEAFLRLVNNYDATMQHNPVALDRFLSLKNRSLQGIPEFKEALLHPLLMALIADEMGGPIKLTDSRGKDVESGQTLERENGPHVDGSPYVQQYKVLLAWDAVTKQGPRRQNFVAIPGTHQVVRAHTTEYGSVFSDPSGFFQEVFDNPDINASYAMEATDEYPLTIVFNANQLVHHRFREQTPSKRSSLLVTYSVDSAEESKVNFLKFLVENRQAILERLISVLDEKTGQKKLIEAREKRMSRRRLTEWITALYQSHQDATQKIKLLSYGMSKEAFIAAIPQIMEYDLQHDLDFKLYPDERDQGRRSVRTRISGKGIDGRKVLLFAEDPSTARRLSQVQQPHPEQFLSIQALVDNAKWLRGVIGDARLNRCADKAPALFPYLFFLDDLEEAYQRCSSIEILRAQSVFQYAVTNQIIYVLGASSLLLSDVIQSLEISAQVLLQHYVAVVMFFDKAAYFMQDLAENLEEEISQITKEKVNALSVQDISLMVESRDDDGFHFRYDQKFGMLVVPKASAYPDWDIVNRKNSHPLSRILVPNTERETYGSIEISDFELVLIKDIDLAALIQSLSIEMQADIHERRKVLRNFYSTRQAIALDIAHPDKNQNAVIAVCSTMPARYFPNHCMFIPGNTYHRFEILREETKKSIVEIRSLNDEFHQYEGSRNNSTDIEALSLVLSELPENYLLIQNSLVFNSIPAHLHFHCTTRHHDFPIFKASDEIQREIRCSFDSRVSLSRLDYPLSVFKIKSNKMTEILIHRLKNLVEQFYHEEQNQEGSSLTILAKRKNDCVEWYVALQRNYNSERVKKFMTDTVIYENGEQRVGHKKIGWIQVAGLELTLDPDVADAYTDEKHRRFLDISSVDESECKRFIACFDRAFTVGPQYISGSGASHFVVANPGLGFPEVDYKLNRIV